MENRKVNLNLKLNEIKEIDDPTVVRCTYIILDFEKSHNNAIVEKDIGMELGETIINKPIVARYIPVSEPNTSTDNFTGHEASLDANKYGDLDIKLNTVPIGVFTSKGYILTINEDGEDKEVLAADALLWKSRFSDAVDLLLEWHNRGININTSCEFLYKNFSVKDGVEYVHSPVYFEGHCHLASEDRGEQGIVAPAYDSSKLLSFNEINEFSRLVAQAFDLSENSKEGENMEFFKKTFELSHSDIRSLMYQQLDPQLGESTDSYISDVYDTYFIVNIYSWADDNSYDKYYKINYTKGENSVTVDFENKVEVFLTRNWEEVTPQETQQQLNEKDEKIEELQTQLNEVNSAVETVKSEKETLVTQFNEASEKIVSLNSQIEELGEFKEKFETAQFEKALNEKTEFYSAKFEAVKAIEKFNSEEVQELIKTAATDGEGSVDAVLQLNTMLVDLVEVKASKQDDNTTIREMASKRENLMPDATDFDSKYA